MNSDREPKTFDEQQFLHVVETFGREAIEELIAKANVPRFAGQSLLAGSGDVQLEATARSLSFRIDGWGPFLVSGERATQIIS